MKDVAKHERRNRENLLEIASRLEAIAEDQQMSGPRLRDEFNQVAKTRLAAPWSSAIEKAFGELEELVKRQDDISDDILRQRIFRCANSMRADLGCADSDGH